MKKEGMTRRKIKGAETKKRLYDGAAKLFALHEFDEVSVDDITKEAGVTKGTFYVHFESKDALIASLISDYVSTVDIDYQKHIHALQRDMSSTEIMLSLIEKITDTLTEKVGYNRMSAVYKVQLTRTLDMEAVQGYNRELYKLFEDVLKRGIEGGEFKTDLPLEVLTKHFVMAIRGLSYEWCIRYPDFDFKEQALMHFSILLNGIK